MSNIKLTNPNAEVYLPAPMATAEAFSRTTHLGVGAHQDDLEFMAMHGILACHGKQDKWFSGITCTNGGGSARTGPFAGTSNEEMVKIRAEEQREAARVGEYSFIAQLGYSSAELKATRQDPFVSDLVALMTASSPEVVYTHNPADKHSTHIAVLKGLLSAIRSLPPASRPKRLIGCEVWRDLDWLPDKDKVVMDLGSDQDLALRLNGIFKSQISGGKRYDLAVEGRRRANATFLDSHSVEEAIRVAIGIDLTPLIKDDTLSLGQFTLGFIDAFRADVEALLAD